MLYVQHNSFKVKLKCKLVCFSFVCTHLAMFCVWGKVKSFPKLVNILNKYKCLNISTFKIHYEMYAKTTVSFYFGDK